MYIDNWQVAHIQPGRVDIDPLIFRLVHPSLERISSSCDTRSSVNIDISVSKGAIKDGKNGPLTTFRSNTLIGTSIGPVA